MNSPLNSSAGAAAWRQLPWREETRECGEALPLMQVYASFRYRRDIVNAAKFDGMLARCVPLGPAHAQQLQVSSRVMASFTAAAVSPVIRGPPCTPARS